MNTEQREVIEPRKAGIERRQSAVGSGQLAEPLMFRILNPTRN